MFPVTGRKIPVRLPLSSFAIHLGAYCRPCEQFPSSEWRTVMRGALACLC